MKEAAGHVAETLGNFEGDESMLRHRQVCLSGFDQLQDSTIEKIAEYGRQAQYDTDAVFQYSSIVILAGVQAEDIHYLHLMQMMDILAEDFEIEDPDDVVSLCLTLSVYDQHLDEKPGIPANIEDRTEYYRALLGVTIALEQVLDDDEVASRHRTISIDEDGDIVDGVPPVLYHNIINGPFRDSPILDGTELLHLVIDNADRTDELMTFITDRKETFWDAMDAYLKNHVSLGSGVL